LTETIKNLYDGVPLEQVFDSAILASRTLIEKDPNYSFSLTARILMHVIRRDILGVEIPPQAGMQAVYPEYFSRFVSRRKKELLDPRLIQIFDVARLGAALNADRDLQFNYLGLQTPL
jgi:ribonucleoside-diphosphate reductase alpha chain